MKQALGLLCLVLTLQPGHVKRILDGDTFVLYHVGVPPEERVRLLGVDTPEKGQAGYDAAAEFTTAWLQAGPSELTTCKRDSFGRVLGVVTRNGESLGQALQAQGLAKPLTR